MTSTTASLVPGGDVAPAGYCSLYLYMTLGERDRHGEGRPGPAPTQLVGIR